MKRSTIKQVMSVQPELDNFGQNLLPSKPALFYIIKKYFKLTFHFIINVYGYGQFFFKYHVYFSTEYVRNVTRNGSEVQGSQPRELREWH